MENKLSQEALDLFIKLQPKIRKVMGALQQGDVVYREWHKQFFVVHSVITDELVMLLTGKDMFSENIGLLAFIPPAINTFNPGHRDLLGMTKHCLGFEFDGNVAILIQTAGEQYKRIYGDTIVLALLKAIVQQEGL